MDRNSTTADATELFAGEAWFDPIEAGLRDRVRSFIEEMVEQELAAALGRERYARSADSKGYRNGTRERQLTGSFGAVAISVPRGRVTAEDGGTRLTYTVEFVSTDARAAAFSTGMSQGMTQSLDRLAAHLAATRPER